MYTGELFQTTLKLLLSIAIGSYLYSPVGICQFYT
jgi:hypothetical protein